MKTIVIAGPTGVGKTKMSIELAKKLDGEIINADSTQIYKGLNIATAKIKEEEKEGIKHHLFDVKEITEEYTVYDYQKDARLILEDIIKRGKTPIIVGGTGLYIKALLYDYKFNKEENANLYEELSNDELYEKLLKIDPTTSIHKNNRRRVVRALNYYENANTNISENKTDKLLYDTVFIGLTTDRNVLYERINKRVDIMVEEGLIDEALELYKNNIRTKAVMTPIGYKELFEYFDNKCSKEEALELIKKRSRNYAKRQYTWFKHQIPINWINVNFENFENTVNEALKLI